MGSKMREMIIAPIYANLPSDLQASAEASLQHQALHQALHLQTAGQKTSTMPIAFLTLGPC